MTVIVANSNTVISAAITIDGYFASNKSAAMFLKLLYEYKNLSMSDKNTEERGKEHLAP